MSDDWQRAQPLYELDTGMLMDDTLAEGVPHFLVSPLRKWCSDFVHDYPRIGTSAGLRLRRGPLTYRSFITGEIHGDRLLHIINVMLQLSANMVGSEADYAEQTEDGLSWPPNTATSKIGDLSELLRDGGSIYFVEWYPVLMLKRRIDPAVTEGIARTLAIADETPGEFLRTALRCAYGFEPKPGEAYAAAVKAVEHVAGPHILPNEPGATLGKSTAHLEQASGKWRFAIAGYGGDDSAEPVAVLMRRLLAGQVSRHAGGSHNRDQTQEEAEAAVQIAVLLVQLLMTKAVNRRPIP